MHDLYSPFWFRVDYLSGGVTAAIVLFVVLTVLYSLTFMKGRKGQSQYYLCVLLSGFASIGAVLANNLVLLLACWGFLGLTLYLLINMGDKDSPAAAKKALVIVGGSDALLVFGVGVIYYFSKTFQMDFIRLELSNGLLVAAYVCIAIACFAKAGAMPFHSWIPDCAKSAPVPVVAFLPASLDKLLGIYLLARVSLQLFVMNNGMNIFLMAIGAFTILAAVMMALVQHNVKRLLGYHAVSQVGYMVLGIGTGNPVGIAGGLFHMLNHALYKSCLFFTAGNVEYRAKTTELDKLGGLAAFMPLTYLSCMVASFSISGVPPFNGFVSKWLIYQGLLQHIFSAQSSGNVLFGVFCLIAAMFGSGLTLASFMKLLHAVFLGQRLNTLAPKEIKEVPWTMWLPCVCLAAICILFGLCAFVLPLHYFIFTAVSEYQPVQAANLFGAWSPLLATFLLGAGLLCGFILFKLGKVKFSLNQDTSFTGGEDLQLKEENIITGIDFYNTIKDLKGLRALYARAEKGTFDMYEQGKKVFAVSKPLQYLHNGVLPSYLVWIFLGAVGLLLTFFR